MRALLAALLATLAAGPAARPSRPCGWEAQPPQHWQHVVWIWMENKSFGQVSSAPYLSRLANGCGVATNYAAVAHPSLPNYLAATSGSDWGIRDDADPSAHPLAQPSIFGQTDWRSYEESMPSNCDRTSSGLYAVKHNPAAYFTPLRAQCRKWDVPLGELQPARLPSFTFITPNLCNDMHDCPVGTGDAWLARWVPRILSGSDYRSGRTALFITFDEAEDRSNRVVTVVVAPSTRPGTRSAARFTHYSLLKTTEDMLGLPHLGHAGASMLRAFRL